MYRVELFPSGRHFIVEPGQTILDAALTAGISVPYQCANGSCGDCRARIVEGRHTDTGHSDYVYGGDDRLHPMLLMCSSEPASDLIIEPLLATGKEDIPHQQIPTTVRKTETPKRDVMVLTLRTPRSNTLRFLAGQQVSLHIPKVGRRTKSIASCPCNGRDLQFHFRYRPGEAFSQHLFNRLRLNETVEIEGPYGDLVFNDESERSVILIAWDTGFAVMKSLIEHIISLETEQPVHLYRLLPGNDHAYLSNQCRAWADALTHFRFDELHTRDATEVLAAIADQYENLRSHDVYMSIPEPLQKEFVARLIDYGALRERIQIDKLPRY